MTPRTIDPSTLGVGTRLIVGIVEDLKIVQSGNGSSSPIWFTETLPQPNTSLDDFVFDLQKPKKAYTWWGHFNNLSNMDVKLKFTDEYGDNSKFIKTHDFYCTTFLQKLE